MNVPDTAEVSTSYDRQPPYSAEAEISVLGGMLIDGDAVAKAVEIIDDSMFFREAHRRLYRGMVRLFERGTVVDIVTVSEELKKTGELEGAGGHRYLAEILEAVPTAANIEYHARIVREKALLRRLLDASSQIIRDVYDQGEREVEQVLDTAEQRIFQVAQSHQREGFVWIKEILWPTFEHIERLQQAESGITGTPTGFKDLDRMTTGLQNGDLVIVAARPAMGKTSLVLNIAQNAAIEGEKDVAIFSLEMSKEQLVQRFLCAEARVDAQKLRRGRLSAEEYQRLAAAAGHLNTAPIWIDDSPGSTVLEMRAKARRLKAETNLDLLIIDYLQLMSGSGRSESRVQEVSDISRGLKALARELEVPVVALSQLSRQPEQRPDKRPQLSDLRESGCLAGSTLVEVADTGRRVPIAEMEGRSGFEVWALDEENMRLTRAEVSRAFCTGRKPVYRLRTRLGREIRATGNHKFRTISGWARLDSLEPGDRVALPRRIGTTAEGSMKDGELALLGHLLGDGCTVPGHAIQYTTKEPELAELVSELASELFGDAVAPRIKRERRWIQVYLASTRNHTHGVRSAVREWLEPLGAWGRRSHEKLVPEAVFEQPAEQVARFLRHLWATDGCIRMRRGKRPYPAVYFASSSGRMARDVQDLLLRVGIRARRKVVSQGDKGRHRHHVIVSGALDLGRFVDRVGAVGAARVRRLEQIRAHLDERTANTNRDVIPADIWDDLVIPAMRESGVTHRELHRRLDMSYGGMTIFKQNVSRDRALRVANAVDVIPLRRLAKSDVYWDEIVSIEEDGVEKVFDLTIPEHHNFVADGVIVHNSIEQDADVVMFLFRPEYYFGAVDKDGNNIEGQAELIIGKQRNGPTGKIDLYFHKAYTRFDSAAPKSVESMAHGGPSEPF